MQVGGDPFFERNLRRAVLDERSPYKLGTLLTGPVERVAGTGGTGEAYGALADTMLTALRDLVSTTEKEIGYLGPLVREAKRSDGLTIATLNYDRAIELAAGVAKVP